MRPFFFSFLQFHIRIALRTRNGVLLETYGFCGNTCNRIEWITPARIIYSRRRTAAGISMSTTERKHKPYTPDAASDSFLYWTTT